MNQLKVKVEKIKQKIARYEQQVGTELTVQVRQQSERLTLVTKELDTMLQKSEGKYL